MSYWLIELPIETAPTTNAQHEYLAKIETAIKQSGATIVDQQASLSAGQLFVVAEAPTGTEIGQALDNAGLTHTAPASVRLVGATPQELIEKRSESRWLVEWDLPEGLTMEQYLERKAANSPKYAEVPEVAFQRTWVREDMAKCLCFYDGPDEDAIRTAREVVGAPVDRLHALEAES